LTIIFRSSPFSHLPLKQNLQTPQTNLAQKLNEDPNRNN
jgi:hypothetical protein